MFGSSHRVSSRSINNQTPVLRRRSQINVIDPNASSSHNLKPPSRGLEHVSPDLRAAPHDQRIAQRDLRAELLDAQIVRAIHVGVLFEQVYPRLAELLRHEDRRFSSSCGGNEDDPTPVEFFTVDGEDGGSSSVYPRGEEG